MRIPAAPSTVQVAYEGLGGVDLSTQSHAVSASRSPDMCNMYKAYADGFSDLLETRPGRTLLHRYASTIHGIYEYNGQICVHAGGGLFDLTGLRLASIEDRPTYGVVFNGSLWMINGTHFYRYNSQKGLRIIEGYVPTTSIGRSPAGVGTPHQRPNLLTPKRINSFRSDGVSTVYRLDAQNIAGIDQIEVNGYGFGNYTYDAATGTVTFEWAPPAAAGDSDNVLITYLANDNQRDKVLACDRLCVFDNRLFVAGAEKGMLRHSALDDPTYFPDNDWYREGECAVTALVAGEGCLYAFTEQGVCRHTPALDYELGRIYPSVSLTVTVGCVGQAAAFLDDIVWLSPRGVEGLGDGFGHRSTLIDAQLSRHTAVRMSVWNSYLCLFADGRLYLADGRAPYRTDGRREYEWFVWDCGVDTVYGVGDRLFWVKGPKVGVFEGSTDEGAPIESYLQTRAESLGDPALRKRVGAAGAIALFKKIAHSDVTVSCVVDGGAPVPLCTFHLGGLDFAALDFSTLSFSFGEQDMVRLPLNVKDFLTLSLRFASRRRFGVAAARYHARPIGYIK